MTKQHVFDRVQAELVQWVLATTDDVQVDDVDRLSSALEDVCDECEEKIFAEGQHVRKEH